MSTTLPKAEFYATPYSFVDETGTSRTVYLKYLKCNFKAITHRYLQQVQFKNTDYYGINGTFFYKDEQKLRGIAINDGQVIHADGQCQEGDLTGETKKGTFVVFKEKVGNIYLFVDQIGLYEGHEYSGHVLSTSDVKFAVGGMSLFPADTTMTKSTFLERISAESDGSQGIDSRNARSAIIYIGGSLNGLNTILLTVHGSEGTATTNPNVFSTNGNGGVTLWELRSIINTYFGAMAATPTDHLSLAIALDGGGSTQIRYKDENNQGIVYATNATSGGWCREMFSVLTVEM